MVEIVSYTLNDLLMPSGRPVEAGIVAAPINDNKPSEEKITLYLLEASKRHDIIVGPEYLYWPGYQPLEESELEGYISIFKEASEKTLIIPGTFVWKKEGRMFNRCYAFYNGRVIHQHDKTVNGGEDALAELHDLYWTGGSANEPFNWNNLKLGIEICAEVGTLAEQGERDLDFVVLVSAGEYELRGSMDAVHKRGCGIVSDGCSNFHFAGNHQQVAEECQKIDAEYKRIERKREKRFGL